MSTEGRLLKDEGTGTHKLTYVTLGIALVPSDPERFTSGDVMMKLPWVWDC